VTRKASYGQILKSAYYMGGAAGITMLLGMVRTKFASILIGTTGIGLLTSFTAVQGIVGSVAGFGIHSSAVRELALVVEKGDELAIARVVTMMRRIFWLTGTIGMVSMMALSPLLSQVTFDSPEYTIDIFALGVVILLGNLASGHLAILQGMRRIGEMAYANITGSIFATLSAIGFYYWLGLRGIVPSLIGISVIQLGISWHFARQMGLPRVQIGWWQTFSEIGGMLKLGAVMMWTGLMGSAASYICIILITEQINLQAVGIYSAAFSLSGMFVNFVLGAMSTDYYPRLTALCGDKEEMNRLVNEQTEVGILLAVPGLLAMLLMAPWIVRVFYTSEFMPAVELLQWFVLGCFIRVFQWPIGFLQLALGRSDVWFVSQTFLCILHVGLIWAGIRMFGLEGVAIAFTVLYMVSIFVIRHIGEYLTGFTWNKSVLVLLSRTIPIVATVFLLQRLGVGFWGDVISVALVVLTSRYSLRGLVLRIGSEHKALKFLFFIPGFRRLVID
jgi:enterobacterial common antigen flippase